MIDTKTAENLADQTITKFIESLPDQETATIISSLEVLLKNTKLEIRKIQQSQLKEVQGQILKILRENNMAFGDVYAQFSLRIRNCDAQVSMPCG